MHYISYRILEIIFVHWDVTSPIKPLRVDLSLVHEQILQTKKMQSISTLLYTICFVCK